MAIGVWPMIPFAIAVSRLIVSMVLKLIVDDLPRLPLLAGRETISSRSSPSRSGATGDGSKARVHVWGQSRVPA